MPVWRKKTWAIALSEFLLLLTLLAFVSDSGPPEVLIADIPRLDPGVEILVQGFLADQWCYEDGDEVMLLVDNSSVFPLKVICSIGAKAMPSTYTSIGDEISVLGELRGTSPRHYLMTDSDSVCLLGEARYVLSVEMLCQHWTEFLDDTVQVRGVIRSSSSPDQWRLTNAEGTWSVQIILEGTGTLGPYDDTLVEGALRFEPQSMAAVFVAISVRPFDG